MVHVWLGIENPDGVFADHNRVVPYLKLGLPAAHAKGAPIAAAHGLDMATPNGCRELIDGWLWIANAKSATSKVLHATCAREAAVVRAALRKPASELNATAAAAWARWDKAWYAALTPAQRARVDAMTEHGGGHGSGHDGHGADHPH